MALWGLFLLPWASAGQLGREADICRSADRVAIVTITAMESFAHETQFIDIYTRVHADVERAILGTLTRELVWYRTGGRVGNESVTSSENQPIRVGSRYLVLWNHNAYEGWDPVDEWADFAAVPIAEGATLPHVALLKMIYREHCEKAQPNDPPSPTLPFLGFVPQFALDACSHY